MERAPTPAVVVHISHASLAVPCDVAADLLLTPEEVEHQLLVMTDRYTGELFALPSTLATTVAFPVSRLVVDPERFTDDSCEPMVAKGMGVVHTKTASGRPLRRSPSVDQRRQLLARFYEPHHAALTKAVEAAFTAHGSCLVLDGHSFPTRPRPLRGRPEPGPRGHVYRYRPEPHARLAARLRGARVRRARLERRDQPTVRRCARPMAFYRKDTRVPAVICTAGSRSGWTRTAQGPGW
jgi:N-formylglutamate deformylase